MARPQVVPKKESNPRPTKKDEPAGPKPNGGAARPSRPTSERTEGEGRPAREPRPVSTRAALGFKDDE